MTPKQNTLYWREWSAAKKAGDLTDADRYTLMEEALCGAGLRPAGSADVPSAHLSSKDLTNEDLDKVLAAFRAISRPTSLNAQLRQQAMPKTRLLHRIEQQLQLLALFVDHPCNYAKSILQDRFDTSFLEDLSADPQVRQAQSDGIEIDDSQLEMMRNTLAARLSKLRRNGVLSEHGRARAQLWGLGSLARGTPEHPFESLTEHDLCIMADIPCRCAECCKKRRPSMSPIAQPNSQTSLATADNIPF